MLHILGFSLYPFVFCRTLVINTIVEPEGILKMPPMAPSPRGKNKSASKEFTNPTSSNANASAKRGPKGPEGGRYV